MKKYILYGIENEENLCYLNSIIHILFSIKPLFNFFKKIKTDDPIVNELHKIALASFDLINEDVIHVDNYYYDDNMKLSSEFLYEKMDKVFNLNGYQHDCHEILNQLINYIHENFKMNIKRTNSLDSFQNYIKYDLSILDDTFNRKCSTVSNLFQGNIKNCIICPNCKKVNSIIEPFMDISLNMKSSLQESVNDFIKCSRLENFSCDLCKFNKYGKSKVSFLNVPYYLIIHLKRYNNLAEKNCSNIDIPKLLKINSEYYKIISTIDHIGESLDYGHYVANLKINENYIQIDDEEITLTKDINPYIIILEKYNCT